MAGAEAVFAMGAAAMQAGDLRAAEQLFHQIVAADARAHQAWNALAVVAIRGGMPEVAAEHAQRALALDRRNPVYLNNLGVALGELSEYARAEDAFRRALKAKPVYAEAMFNLGKVLHKRGDLAGSLRAYERAYAMDPRFPGLLAALSQLYRKHGRTDLALGVLRAQHAENDEELVPAITECMADAEGPDAALAWVSGVIERHPQWGIARFSRSTLELSLGLWRQGWSDYLWRRNILAERETGVPPPLAERCDGLRVRLRSEQGFGDTLFFLRFVAELQRRGAEVSLVLAPRLAALLQSAPLELIAEAEAGPAALFDRDLPCGDLPGLLKVDAVAPPFPLQLQAARMERLRERLRALGPPPYLGLTWRAGADVLHGQEFGRERALLSKEVPPAELGAALRGWSGTLVTVQREPRPAEVAAATEAAGAPLHDLSALNEDLPEVLALLALLDEYVCVSNTNVHLLAGIGRTARVLVPYPAEWRWMRTIGPSAWFPGFAVYREPLERGWTRPLADLRKDIFR